MTLDEAIVHCEDVVKDLTNVDESELDLMYCGDTECINEHMNRCVKCADEHRQLAEWLKDYKRLKEQEPKTVQEKQADSEKYQKAFDDGYDNGYAQARFDYEQEPCEDCIDRAELLKAIDTWDKFGYTTRYGLERLDKDDKGFVPYVKYGDMLKCIKGMPSVKPQEPFINKACVSTGVCEHDKNVVLGKDKTMQLSIIIPYYNAEPYTNKLLSVLDRQMCPDVEVILVDDGSETPFKANYKWLSIIRQPNAGVSGARNTGLDHATGDYIAFIDSDDMVSDNYINSILECIKAENPDYIYLSWKTMQGGWQCDVKLKSINDKFPSFNLCVWNRIYKKPMIGKVRFNTKKLIAEDAEFIRLVDENGKKKAFISDYMYFYRSTTPDSLTKRFAKGELLTKRIVYHIPHVKKSMTRLINEFKEADREGEVILLTNNCEIKELSNYAMIMPVSSTIKGTELRGQYTPNFIKIDLPQNYQIIIWTKKTFSIGGIETFIYNFCKTFYNQYDILVLYDEIDIKQLIRLSKFVKVSKISDSIKYKCETLIINRITDAAPKNIVFQKKIQMCHTCKMGQPWTIPTDNDTIVFPSEVAKESFNNKSGIVIPNPLPEEPTNRALTLVTASRLDTFEKGKSRIIKLCELLKESNIPFVWLVFTKTKLDSCPDGIIQMDARLDIKPYIKTADYLVQLSDAESFCYSIVEALTLGTKVITTPIDVLSEIGFVDKKTGYIIDYDLKDVDIDTIYANKDKPFSYTYDNNKVINSWTELLGNNPPKHLYNPQTLVQVLVTKDYNDLALATKLKAGTKLCMTRDRAETVKRAGYLKILES